MDDQNQNPQQVLLDTLKGSTNILVTVSKNPSVDQLAACLGMTLWLNKVGKHATAVFSGEVPSTLEFLKPAETLEKTTDSLRDFIIALDKSKADKLRYKVEDSVVKIFITPYRTSLSADDLEFSQGDFNVDMVLALGVHDQADLDTAVTAHGRILHDAAVATVTIGESASQLGSIGWHDQQASSLSELVVDMGNLLDRTQLDGQIATALLTGIVAETKRFSNEKTTPQTMSISAELMSAGANQQLVASELEEPAEAEAEAELKSEPETGDEQTQTTDNEAPDESEAPTEPVEEKNDDGAFQIDHQADEEEYHHDHDAPHQPEVDADESEPAEPEQSSEPEQPADAPAADSTQESSEEPAPDESAQDTESHDEATPPPENQPSEEPADEDDHHSRLMTEPPMLGGQLTANNRPDDIMREPSSDALSQPTNGNAPLLNRDDSQEPQTANMQPAPPDWMPQQPWMQPPADQPATAQVSADNQSPTMPFTPDADDTLADIEQAVGSPHLGMSASPDVDNARDEVMRAIDGVPPANPEPIQALNAQPMDLNDAAPEAALPPVPPAFDPNAPSPYQFNPAAFDTANDSHDLPTSLPNEPVAPKASQPDAFAPNMDLTGPVEQPFTLPVPGSLQPMSPAPQSQAVNDPNSPPPVPPPMFPTGRP